MASDQPLAPVVDGAPVDVSLRSAILAMAAGSEFRKGRARRRFMQVSLSKSGYGAIHCEDEKDMLTHTSGASGTEKASTAASLTLTGPKAPAPDDSWGTYTIASSSYGAASFSFEAKDIIMGDEVTSHLSAKKAAGELELKQAKGKHSAMHAEHALGQGVAYYMVMRKENVTFANNCIGRFLAKHSSSVVYTLTVSHNGMVRFHLPNDTPAWLKIAFLIGDSEPGCCTGFRNLRHALTHGCFCMGVFYEAELPAKDGAAGGTVPVLMRFNRWMSDVGLTPYWAGVRSVRQLQHV